MTPRLRALPAALVALLAASGLVAVAAPAVAAPQDDVEINEIVSDGPLDDWIELVNLGGAAVDVSGWVVQDEDLGEDGKEVVLATGTSIPAGGYLQVTVASGFGLGNGDAVTVLLADRATVVDTQAYPEHSLVSWSACPEGGETFVQSDAATPGAANACAADPRESLVLNEVEADDPAGEDWIELRNTSRLPADVSGFVVRDDKDSSAYVFPAGTVVPGEGYLVIEGVADFDFGLGKGGDEVRLFAPDGTTAVDSVAWAAENATTLGRCPDGRGEFGATAAATRGAANVCALGPGAAELVINELHTGDDWVELGNPGDADVAIDGWWLADDGDPVPLPAGLTVPAGGHLVLEKSLHDIGFGNGDEVHLLYSDGVTEIDVLVYDANAATSWARCPDLTGGFGLSSAATPAAPNACAGDPADVRINEIDAAGGWVELTNVGLLAVDAGGLTIDGGDGTTLPAGTSIPAGGFVAVDVASLEAATGVVRVLDGATELDAHAWQTAADETWARCPDGTGAFADSDAPTRGAANDCPPYAGADAIAINEIESSGDTVDWVELVNTGDAAVDLAGWVFRDSDDEHRTELPAGASIPAGGFYVVEPPLLDYGLGNDDQARLFTPDGVLVDSHSWGPHAATTYGRCPDGTGEFLTTFSPTKGAANDCSAVRLNEVDSSNLEDMDWVELVNVGESAADVSGYVLRDENDDTGVVIADGTVLAPGAFLAVDVDIADEDGGFGLGGSDTARLFAADGTTLLASFSYDGHAATTYGRCPDGTGAFEVTATATKGSANDCGILNAGAWPGPETVTTVDAAAAFGADLSGLAYEPTGGLERGALWAVQNGDGLLYRLAWSGGAWVPASGWEDGATLRYPGGTGSVDAEGVGLVAGAASNGVYVASERDNAADDVSRPSVLRYDVSGGAGSLAATHEWNLDPLLPTLGNNTGLEGVAWVPDAHLVGRGFVDASTGEAYDPAGYGPHAGGVFVVAVEANGLLYAVVLEDDGTATLVATIDPKLGLAADVTFDASTGLLWAVCDEACDGRTATLDVAQDGAFDGSFRITAVYDNPVGMDDGLANEGFAIAPTAECVDGVRAVWYADDAGTAGHALREAGLRCAPTGGPGGSPVPPAEDDLTPETEGGVTGPATVVQGGTITITVTGDHAGEEVDVWILSTPAHLGTFVLPESGRLTVTIPSSVPAGPHRIAVLAADGTVIGWYGIVVTPAALGVTGGTVTWTLLPLAALSLLGGAAVLAVVGIRRRRAV